MGSADFARIWDAQAFAALAPLIALSVGLLALLMVGVLTPARWARGVVVAATFSCAFVLQAGLLHTPIGVILDGTYSADRASALWGLLFLAGTAMAWLYSLNYYSEDRPYKVEHDALMLATPIGMMLMAGAQDLLVFFVGL